MPDSMRQKFIIKIRQSINLLTTVDTYLMKIHLHCYGTDYGKNLKRIVKQNTHNIKYLKRFMKEVRGW